MSEPTASTVADKVVDKISGALERLVDMRMLVLGMSFLMYLDIWLISGNVDPNQMTIDGAVGKMRLLSLGSLAIFVVSYSLLMSAVFPALRFIYVQFMVNFYPMKGSLRDRSIEDRKLSDWSLGFVAFIVWDGLSGFFQGENYRGVTVFLFRLLSGDGFIMGMFRVSVIFFLFYCFCLAFLERND